MSDLPLSGDMRELVNAHLGGFDQSLGLRFVSVASDELVAELTIDARHLQPYGLVHGGVYAAMIETTCSTGAALSVMPEGKSAVGLENATSFLRAVREGTLRCTARPLHRGGRSQVWQGEVHDQEDRLLATGRVRLLILDQKAHAAGAALELKPTP